MWSWRHYIYIDVKVKAARQHWRNYLERNQSIVVQLFCGQTRYLLNDPHLSWSWSWLILQHPLGYCEKKRELLSSVEVKFILSPRSVLTCLSCKGESITYRWRQNTFKQSPHINLNQTPGSSPIWPCPCLRLQPGWAWGIASMNFSRRRWNPYVAFLYS